MATASKDPTPLTRSLSYELIPPYMSELRVVLLGNSWSHRCSVGNLLLNKTVFSSREEPLIVKFSEPLIDKKLTVINTPDLLHPDITEGQLTEYIQQLAHASAPGPHVFLLVLQPQAFTQTQQQRTQSVLSKFSEHPFDHSLVVVSTDQEESPDTVFVNNQPLEKMIQKCRYRYLWLKSFGEEEIKLRNFKISEILSRLSQIVRENSGSHLNYEEYEDSLASAPSALPDTTQKGVLGIMARVQREGITAGNPREKQVSQSSPIVTNHLRMLLFGKSDEQKKIIKFITGKSKSNKKVEHGQWGGKHLTVVKAIDLLTKSVKEVRKDIQTCVSYCSPGPNVLLLLVRPSDFTEDTRGVLKFFLTMLGPNALKHSIVVVTHNEKPTAFEHKLIADCDYRFYQSSDQNLSTLMEQVEKIVANNNTPYVTFTEAFSKEEIKMCLNLVLCGRKWSGKTTVADAILGSASSESSSECLKRQGEVCGRWLSVVEMPALSEKSAKDAMEQCFDCISQCEEGVHAFALVLPMDPLTDEDKAEFKTIQTILHSEVNAFTMVLFSVESDPGAPAYTEFVKENKEIQELCQNCGGRYVIFNIKNKLQVPLLLDKVESLTKNRNVPQSYTQRVFVHSQIEKLTAQSHLTAPGTILSENKRIKDSLRIVLIGKTGSGKSASGNTILGLKLFKFALAQTSVTKLCQKEVSEVDGRRVEVVDTPGLFDSTLNHLEINEEMIKCISLLAPGPHVFLVVLQIGSRFTPEEKETLNLIKKGFGKDAEKFTIVLFTHGDGLKNMDMSFEDYIDTCLDGSCKKLISDCGNRCHVFNNNEKDQERPKAQVTELIHKIDAMVEANGGGCYTNEMLQEAEAAIQKEMKRLLKEKEDEFMREKQEIEEKHEKEMQNIQMRLEKQREENETERQERVKELRELQSKITQERKLRKAEQDMREEKDRERQKIDEAERQEWEKKLKIVTEESRETLVCEREAWEEKTRQWWEKRHKEDEQRRNEEYVRLQKLEEEYNDKIQTFKTKKEEEDRKRREQEERERRELEERHQINVKELKKMYEEKARKTAEEVNEFQQKMKLDFAAQIQKHLDKISSLKEEIEQEQIKYKLSSHKEKSLRSEIQDLRNKHKSEMIELVTAVLLKQKENNNKIRDVQNRHKQELEKCKKEIVEKFKQKKRKEIETLKIKQQQEMDELKKNTKKDDLGVKTQELSARHTEEVTQLKNRIWNKQKQELDEETRALKERHKEELTKVTQDLLMEHEKHQEKQISELETKQKQEMEQFMKTDGTEISPEEEQQQAKHEEEMRNIKTTGKSRSYCTIL